MPIEYRKVLGIKAGDELDIILDGNRVLLQKPGAICAFCGSETDLILLHNIGVCRSCVSLLQNRASMEAEIEKATEQLFAKDERIV